MHVCINTNGVVTFIDQQNKIKRELFRVELRSDLQPMLTVEIRDNKNQLLGKAYQSTSFVYTHPDYEGIIETEGADVKRLALKRKENDALIFDIVKKSANEVEINGIFHIKGYPHTIVANINGTMVGTNLIAYGTMNGGGTGITLTPNGIGF